MAVCQPCAPATANASDSDDDGPRLILDSAGRVACSKAATAGLDFGFRAAEKLFGPGTAQPKCRRCRSAAPPSPSRRRFARDDEGMSAD